MAKLCYGPVDGKTTCSSTQVEGCPPPLTCADLAGRTEVAKCKKADTDDCAASFYWMDESSGLARLCYGPEDGETTCSATKVEGCTSPTASPSSAPSSSPSTAPSSAPSSSPTVSPAPTDASGCYGSLSTREAGYQFGACDCEMTKEECDAEPKDGPFPIWAPGGCANICLCTVGFGCYQFGSDPPETQNNCDCSLEACEGGEEACNAKVSSHIWTDQCGSCQCPSEEYDPTCKPKKEPSPNTNSAVAGFAAPEDISTIAEFEDALNAAMKLLFGVPASSSCIVDTSAIQYAVSNPVCTDAFRADQLTGSFCYIFQTTISPPPRDQVIPPCAVNELAQQATVELEDDGFEAVIGPVAGIGELLVPT